MESEMSDDGGTEKSCESLISDNAEKLESLSLATKPPRLSQAELDKLEAQRRRPVSSVRAARLETDARRHWDLFYKRNGTNFFKDRKWTWREFRELLPERNPSERRTLLEVGCGVGNLVFPLIEERLNDYYLYACDISPRAVDLVKANPLYDESVLKAFLADLTTNELFEHVSPGSIDVVTVIFVLSAIHPDKFQEFLKNVYDALKPEGIVLFRDYGLYDMAQLRFKPGHLISENFYMRQDGTRSYFFELEELSKLFKSVGFQVVSNDYVERRTINIKEQIDIPRNFVQGKFKKPPV